jgi:hypothetical protein
MQQSGSIRNTCELSRTVATDSPLQFVNERGNTEGINTVRNKAAAPAADRT